MDFRHHLKAQWQGLTIIPYAADGKFVFKHFWSSPCHAIVLDRPNAYPCPLRKFRTRFDQCLKEAGKGGKGDTPKGQNPSMTPPPSATSCAQVQSTGAVPYRILQDTALR